MIRNNTLLKGTFLLTLAGFISRFIGFFYRIFLSNKIGAEGIGIYQMVFPLFALTFSITGAGLQTSISKYIAENPREKNDFLGSGIFLSCIFSIFCMVVLYRYSGLLATSVLNEERCAPLIRILALSIPFEAIHSCVNGFYLGQKKAVLPSLTQLLEQGVRVCSVILIYSVMKRNQQIPSISVAVLGIVFGEFASMCTSVCCAWFSLYKESLIIKIRASSCRNLLSMSLPLTANRVVLNLLASTEAICIPGQLQHYGLSKYDALSSYGVLTGMALPLILFPSAITNSLSVMMVPAISDTMAHGGTQRIDHYIRKSMTYCIIFGLGCTLFFLIFGRFLGALLFHNSDCGNYLLILCFLCPFLYLNTTLSSILHGLGRTSLTFTYSVLSLTLRLLFVFLCIPRLGIYGYFAGLLISQAFHSILLIRSCLGKSIASGKNSLPNGHK